MMKRIYFLFFVLGLFGTSNLTAQTALTKAKNHYKAGEYAEALPLFEAEQAAKPTDATINHWYGVCLFNTGSQDFEKIEKHLKVGSAKRIKDSYLYLGRLYAKEYRFKESEAMFKAYEKFLRRIDVNDKAALEGYRKEMARLNRMVSHTEDIQIIDSVVVDKSNFLSAYKMSSSTGRLDVFNNVFPGDKLVESTVYLNEFGTKAFYAAPPLGLENYSLFSKEKLIDGYSKEKQLSSENFGLVGNLNYPFLQADGLTIYFAAEDKESIGGYDLFVSRYNLNNDTYLTPERLNMPFNSIYNDYMLVIDEEKGNGWFASDRFQPEGKVCVYTFIPNDLVKIIEDEDETYLRKRANITSIKDSWVEGKSYTQDIARAREEVKVEKKIQKDFEFVVNDKTVYFTLKDFKSKAAKDLYSKVLQLRKQYASLQDKLEGDRVLYSRSAKDVKSRLENDILTNEGRIKTLEEDIKRTEKQARNTEIGHLNKK